MRGTLFVDGGNHGDGDMYGDAGAEFSPAFSPSLSLVGDGSSGVPIDRRRRHHGMDRPKGIAATGLASGAGA